MYLIYYFVNVSDSKMLELLWKIWSYVDPNNTGSNVLHFFKGSFASTFLVGLVVFILVQKYLETREQKTPVEAYFAEDEINEKKRNAPKTDVNGCQTGGGICCQGSGEGSCKKSTKSNAELPEKIVVLYGTTTGSSRKFAEELTEKLNGKGLNCTVYVC